MKKIVTMFVIGLMFPALVFGSAVESTPIENVSTTETTLPVVNNDEPTIESDELEAPRSGGRKSNSGGGAYRELKEYRNLMEIYLELLTAYRDLLLLQVTK